MPGILASTWLLFRMHLRRVFWSRRALAGLALALAVPALAGAVASVSTRTTGVAIATHLGWLLLLQVVVPLVALLAGSAVVTEEIEDRTITYLISRPIPRAAILLGRWLATLVLVTSLLGTSAVLTVALASRSAVEGPPAGAGVLGPLLLATVAGGAVYSALFAAAGVFLRHPMIVGLGYAFAVEGFLANLSGRNQALTIQYHLRSLIADTGSSVWRQVEGFAGTSFEPAGSALLTLAIVLVAVLALASWRIGRREFVLSA